MTVALALPLRVLLVHADDRRTIRTVRQHTADRTITSAYNEGLIYFAGPEHLPHLTAEWVLSHLAAQWQAAITVRLTAHGRATLGGAR